MMTMRKMWIAMETDDMALIVREHIGANITGVYAPNSVTRKYAVMVYDESDYLKCAAVGRKVCEELALRYIELIK
jgi:hypothetical protein